MKIPESNKEQQLILHAPVWKMMWQLSWPAVVAMVLYGMNVVVDGVFVGHFVGESALAGVTVVYPMTQIPLGLGSLIGVGAGSLLSILLGQKAVEKQARLLGNVNALILFTGVLTTALGLVFLDPLLRLLGASGSELRYGADYISTALYCSIFWIGGLAYNMIVRAEGKMATAAWMMGAGLGINILFNYILMGILKTGVKGAAWGTNIGMLVYALLFFIYCGRGKASFKTNLCRLCLDRSMAGEMLGLGFPSFLLAIMYVIQSLVIMRSLNTYGTPADLALYGSVFRLFNLFLTPIYGLMRALQPAVGINFGAGRPDRVIRSFKVFALAALLLMLPLWLVTFAMPETMLSLMLPDRVFQAADIANFRIFISVAPFLPIMFMAMTFWPAIKKPKPAGILGIVRQALLYIPAMILLPKYFGIGWIYRGSFLIDLLLSGLVLLLIAGEFKKLRQSGAAGGRRGGADADDEAV